MKPKTVVLIALLGFILFSCDSSLFIKVSLTKQLKDVEKYSLVDYDFVISNTGGSDELYFEFVLNKKLKPSIPITFLDQSGNVIVTKVAGEPVSFEDSINSVPGDQAIVYSIMLNNLHSVSLVHTVIIGNQ